MKKLLIILLTVILLGLGGLILYKSLGNESIPEYLNDDYKGIVKEKITKQEAKERLSKYNGTCGLENVDEFDDESGKTDCMEVGYDYLAYIDNGTPVYMYTSSICDANDSCEDDEEHFDVIKYTFIKNARKIISKYDQYNGSEFAFELNNGDVYYFTPLYDDVNVNGVSYSSHLVKIDLPSKLKKFSNVGNGEISFGTEIVLELENNEKYVLVYDYDTNKTSLTKYDNYIEEHLYEENDEEDTITENKVSIKANVRVTSYFGKLNLPLLKVN